MPKSLSLRLALRYTGDLTKAPYLTSKSLSSVIGLGIGCAVLIIVLSIVNGFERELTKKVLSLVPHGTINSSQPLGNWQQSLEYINENYTGLDFAPLVNFQGLLVNGDEIKIATINGINTEYENRVSNLSSLLKEGDLNSLAEQKYGMIIGAALAKELNLEVHDKVKLVLPDSHVTLVGLLPRYRQFTVVGIFELGAEVDQTHVYINLVAAAKLKRMGGHISSFRVKTPDIFSAPIDMWRLAEMLNDDDYIKELNGYSQLRWRSEDWTTTYGPIYEIIQMTKSMLGLLVLLIIIVAAFNIVSSLIMLVNDKRAEIAILLSMGMTPLSILNVFLYLGMSSAVLGLLLAYLVSFVVLLNIGSMVLWLEDVSGLDLTSSYPVHYIPVEVQFWDLMNVSLFALVLSLLATLYPAYQALQVQPALELKSD